MLEGKAGAAEMLSLAGLPSRRQQHPHLPALPPAALGISQVRVYLHCPMVLNGSKVASCFLAIMIPFFLSYAFHLEILEAFNW